MRALGMGQSTIEPAHPESGKPVHKRETQIAGIRARTDLPQRKRAHSELLWTIAVIALGLWATPWASYIHMDDPFLFNPMIIAGGLILTAFARPIVPQTALAFCIVPYILNFFGMALTLPGNYFSSYFKTVEFVVAVVAFAASLIIVPIICSSRRYQE